jgi:hypothetical protein
VTYQVKYAKQIKEKIMNALRKAKGKLDDAIDYLDE